MISDLSHWCLLIALTLVCSCTQKGNAIDVKKERDVAELKICSAKTLLEAEASLKSLDMEYFISGNGSTLNAIKHYDSGGLVSSAITIELEIRSEVIESCKVKIVYTGP